MMSNKRASRLIADLNYKDRIIGELLVALRLSRMENHTVLSVPAPVPGNGDADRPTYA